MGDHLQFRKEDPYMKKKIALVIAVIIVGLATCFFILQMSSSMKDKIDEIEIGMTYSEVVELIGEPDGDVGSGFIIYEWSLGGKEKLHIWFSRFDIEGKYNFEELYVNELRVDTE